MNRYFKRSLSYLACEATARTVYELLCGNANLFRVTFWKLTSTELSPQSPPRSVPCRAVPCDGCNEGRCIPVHIPPHPDASPSSAIHRDGKRQHAIQSTSSVKAYGKFGLFPFSYWYPHYSLKIPPKKRRRFTQKIWPLPHVSSPPAGLFHSRSPRCSRERRALATIWRWLVFHAAACFPASDAAPLRHMPTSSLLSV